MCPDLRVRLFKTPLFKAPLFKAPFGQQNSRVIRDVDS